MLFRESSAHGNLAQNDFFDSRNTDMVRNPGLFVEGSGQRAWILEACYIAARKTRRRSRAKVKWEMAVQMESVIR